MKVIIKRKTYNTETAEKLDERFVSFFGDPAGYEENLYKTKKGDFFLYAKGGSQSKYPKETIIPLTEKERAEWKKNSN